MRNDNATKENKMTKVSEISLPTMIETRTDAHRVLRDDSDRQHYMGEYGDVECYYDSQFQVYRVPSLSARIAKYVGYKSVDCAKWGCE
jgi:hypothetical protein